MPYYNCYGFSCYFRHHDENSMFIKCSFRRHDENSMFIFRISQSLILVLFAISVATTKIPLDNMILAAQKCQELLRRAHIDHYKDLHDGHVMCGDSFTSDCEAVSTFESINTSVVALTLFTRASSLCTICIASQLVTFDARASEVQT